VSLNIYTMKNLSDINFLSNHFAFNQITNIIYIMAEMEANYSIRSNYGKLEAMSIQGPLSFLS